MSKQYIYALFDGAAQEYGVLTLHKSEEEAIRSLCMQIDANSDLKMMMCMDFSLVCLGEFDANNFDEPVLLNEKLGLHELNVCDLYKDYLKQKQFVEKELVGDDNS